MHIRKSARVVILNDRDEVFMFRHTGKTRTYWVLPGGGVEEGESPEDAALREMWEETGVSGVPLGPCLWTRTAINRAGGTPSVRDERYYLVRCGDREISTANQLPNELAHYTANHWWSIEQIRASSEVFWPDGLADLLQRVIAGRLPPEPLPLRE